MLAYLGEFWESFQEISHICLKYAVWLIMVDLAVDMRDDQLTIQQTPIQRHHLSKPNQTYPNQNSMQSKVALNSFRISSIVQQHSQLSICFCFNQRRKKKLLASSSFIGKQKVIF